MGMGMGSAEEPDKSSSSSSTSQPLLSKSPPPPPYHPHHPTPPFPTGGGGGGGGAAAAAAAAAAIEEDSSHYHHHHQTDLIESDENQYPQITFNYGPRQFQDLPFLILFLLFALSTFGFGIFSIVHRNPNYHLSSSSSFIYDLNTTSCINTKTTSFPPSPPPTTTSNGNWMMNSTSSSSSWAEEASAAASASASSHHHHLIEDLIWTLVVTFVLAGPFALGLVWLLRHYTKQIVYASLPLFVVLPIFFNVYWFVACTLSSTCTHALPLLYRILVLLFVFVIIGVIVWIIVANWHRIELTIRIVRVASDALARNLRLFVVLPSLMLALLLYFAPIVVFLVFAPRNGNIVPPPPPPRLNKADGGAGSSSSSSSSCVWKQDTWVPAYFALAIITMLWSAAAMVEAQVFVLSGTIAQWYFSKEEEDDSDSTTPSTRSIRTSLRNAFGPSFGTVCFSGLLIGVVRVLRAAIDSARREDVAPGIVNLIMRCCVNALFSTVDFLNRFTINFAAITGEAYCSSAQMTYELLKRNLLSAVFVETVSTRILAGIIFVLSAIYAIAVCGILKAVSDLEVEVYFVAALAWVLLISVLGFFVHVLDNVIETVYVCFAIDRDKGEVFKQEVHDVYVHLPISRNHRPSLATRTPLLV